MRKSIKIFAIFLMGFINFLSGFVLMLILSNLQCFPLGILLCGSLIMLNFSRFSYTLYNRLIYCAIIPLIVLFSLIFIMMLVDKSLPAAYRTSIPVGLIVLFCTWGIVFANLFLSRFICDKDCSKRGFVFSDIIGISFMILGIISLGFGFFSLPLSASRYAKGLPLGFWIGTTIIFSGILKMRIMKHIFTQNLRNISIVFLLLGLLDALIGYIFIKHISKIFISVYLIILFVIPSIYYSLLRKLNKT